MNPKDQGLCVSHLSKSEYNSTTVDLLKDKLDTLIIADRRANGTHINAPYKLQLNGKLYIAEFNGTEWKISIPAVEVCSIKF